MDWIKKAWAKIKTLNWAYLRTFEPTMLRAAWVAVLGLLASVGIAVSPAFQDKVGVWLTAAISIIAILQGLWTRSAVTPTVVSDALVAEALYTPVPPDPEPVAEGETPVDVVPSPTDVQDDGSPA